MSEPQSKARRVPDRVGDDEKGPCWTLALLRARERLRRAAWLSVDDPAMTIGLPAGIDGFRRFFAPLSILNVS